jgi:hypothetical protein
MMMVMTMVEANRHLSHHLRMQVGGVSNIERVNNLRRAALSSTPLLRMLGAGGRKVGAAAGQKHVWHTDFRRTKRSPTGVMQVKLRGFKMGRDGTLGWCGDRFGWTFGPKRLLLLAMG